MPLQPISFRVLVRPDPVMEVTKSGIQLVLDKRMEMNAGTKGTIVAIGDDAFADYKPSKKFAGLQVGDRVGFAKYSGQWQTDPDTKEELLLVNDGDITCKVVSDADNVVATEAS